MKKTLSILLALSMMLSVAAVGSSATAAGPESPAGSYKLTGLESGSGSNLQIVSTIVDMGVKYYLFLRGDGTGSMNFLEAEIPLEWDDDSIILQPGKGFPVSDPLRIPYTCEDGLLKMSTLAYSLDFSALTDDEQAYYEENGSGSLGGLVGRAVNALIGRMDGGLVEGLLFDLALGMMSSETEPIPEGKPTEGTVTGVVDGMEFTVLGADSLWYEGNDYIVFFYDAVNRGDALDAVWLFECDAAQDGEFLEETWDLDSIVPEHYNVNYDIYPGRTIRCASVFPFDPEGGVVGLRIGDYDSDSTVLYYADPQDLSGAPAEPFVFDADPSIPEELAALPREAGDVRIEDAEFFTDENGAAAVRFYFRYLNGSSYDYYARLLQDGIEVMYNWDDVERQEEDPEDEERLRSLAYTLRTGSPVVFVMYEEGASGTDTPVAAMVMEVG